MSGWLFSRVYAQSDASTAEREAIKADVAAYGAGVRRLVAIAVPARETLAGRLDATKIVWPFMEEKQA